MALRTRMGAQTIDSLLQSGASDAPALLYGDDDTMTYGELTAAADALAERLGDVTGLRVAVVAPNNPALAAGMLAAWRAGAVAVPVSARLREYDLGRILADAEVSAAVTVERHGGFSFRDLMTASPPPSLQRVLVVDRAAAIEDEIELGASAAPEPLAPDVAALLYTSGTTGTPKGALIGHATELHGAREMGAALELGAGDVCAFVIPLAHAFGLLCFLAALARGAAAALVESSTTLDPLLAAVEQRGANVVHGSPPLFASLVKQSPERLAGVRGGFTAGSHCPPELLERLDAMGVGVLNCWGMTEIGAGTLCRPADPLEKRHSTVGRPLPGYEMRSRDGELQVRGPYVTSGYHGRPEQTAAAFDGDWFRTGDLGSIGDDGYVSITGRAKDVVHVGGFNVSPAEVEGLLLTSPDVAAAVVVGVPSEHSGERLHAFVTAAPGARLESADVRRFARSRLAGYKVPYAVDVVDELPTLASGKPDREALRRSLGEVAGAA